MLRILNKNSYRILVLMLYDRVIKFSIIKESRMHKMVVFAKAVPGKVTELAAWYDEQHINDLLAVPGLLTAERHTLMPVKQPDGSPAWDFMLIYELEGQDPSAALQNMGKAQIAISDLLESTSTLSVIAISQGLRKEA
jgi:hypothetical protein